MTIRGESDLRRQVKRLKRMIDTINLGHPLGAGFHATMKGIIRDIHDHVAPGECWCSSSWSIADYTHDDDCPANPNAEQG